MTRPFLITTVQTYKHNKLNLHSHSHAAHVTSAQRTVHSAQFWAGAYGHAAIFSDLTYEPNKERILAWTSDIFESVILAAT